MTDREQDLRDLSETDQKPDEFTDNFAAITAEEIEKHEDALEEAMRGMMIDSPEDLDDTQPAESDGQAKIETSEVARVEPDDSIRNQAKTVPVRHYYDDIEERNERAARRVLGRDKAETS